MCIIHKLSQNPFQIYSHFNILLKVIQSFFASQVSDSYILIYPLADVLSVYMMCFKISGHPIILHQAKRVKTVLFKCLNHISKHSTMKFCLTKSLYSIS